jgi:hypothetical protein
MGVQMVSRGRFEQAVAVLDAICEGYPFHESFIAGQVSGVACNNMFPFAKGLQRAPVIAAFALVRMLCAMKFLKADAGPAMVHMCFL